MFLLEVITRACSSVLHALLLGALLLSACADSAVNGSPTIPAPSGQSEATPAPASITFMAGFAPQANLPFVAAYVAKARGFFDEERLDVDIQHSAGQDEHLRLLLDGRVDFTTGTAAQALRRREQGLPVQAIALFGQRGDQGFVARADSGIAQPANFRGRSIGFKAGVVPAELLALLNVAGLSTNDVRLQGVGFDPRVFIEGGVDVFPVFLSNEPDTIRRAGVAINVIDPADYGVATLGVVYLATDELMTQHPDIARRFLRATMRGAAYARDHEDEAVAITLEYARGADAAHQKYMLQTDLRNARRADGLGRFDNGQWQSLEETLLKFDVMQQRVNLSDVANSTLIDSLYTDGSLQ